MHHEIETPDRESPDPPADARRGITLLSSVYLEAGLPLDLAVQSAIADYALFEEEPGRS
jgi:hypothetical protein